MSGLKPFAKKDSWRAFRTANDWIPQRNDKYISIADDEAGSVLYSQNSYDSIFTFEKVKNMRWIGKAQFPKRFLRKYPLIFWMTQTNLKEANSKWVLGMANLSQLLALDSTFLKRRPYRFGVEFNPRLLTTDNDEYHMILGDQNFGHPLPTEFKLCC